MGLYWPGWWVWAFVIFCFSDLTSPGVRWRFAFRHPLRDEAAPLSRTQKWVAAVALVIFVMTFPPVPFTISFD